MKTGWSHSPRPMDPTNERSASTDAIARNAAPGAREGPGPDGHDAEEERPRHGGQQAQEEEVPARHVADERPVGEQGHGDDPERHDGAADGREEEGRPDEGRVAARLEGAEAGEADQQGDRAGKEEPEARDRTRPGRPRPIPTR